MGAVPAPRCTRSAAFDVQQLRRIAVACEQRGVDVRSAFRAFDANGDGLLSLHEFRHALMQLRLGLSDDDIRWLMARLDTSADGMVSYEEFLTHLFRSVQDPGLANIGQAFREHYAAQDDVTHHRWQKLGRAFAERGIPVQQIFALFDADGDGVISRQELSDAMRMIRLGLNEDDI